MNKTDLRIAMFKINDTQETLTKAMKEFKIQPLPLVSIIENDCNVHFFHGSFENGTYKGKRTRTSLLELSISFSACARTESVAAGAF